MQVRESITIELGLCKSQHAIKVLFSVKITIQLIFSLLSNACPLSENWELSADGLTKKFHKPEQWFNHVKHNPQRIIKTQCFVFTCITHSKLQ